MASREEVLNSAGRNIGAMEQREQTGSGVNVGQPERWASAIGGGASALYGLTRGSLGGIALAILGGALVQRGVSGHRNVYGAMGYNTSGKAAPRGSDNVSVPGGRGIKVEKSVTINRLHEELYSSW